MIPEEQLIHERKELESQLEQVVATANAIKGAIQMIDKLIGGQEWQHRESE